MEVSVVSDGFGECVPEGRYRECSISPDMVLGPWEFVKEISHGRGRFFKTGVMCS